MEPVVFNTQEEVDACVAEWLKKLKLQAWYVKAEIRRERDFANAGRQAEINWVLQKLSASMHLLDPIDYDPSIITPQDMEVSTVHELLHLLMAPFDLTKADSLEDTMLEQAVDILAQALVAEKRRGLPSTAASPQRLGADPLNLEYAFSPEAYRAVLYCRRYTSPLKGTYNPCPEGCTKLVCLGNPCDVKEPCDIKD